MVADGYVSPLVKAALAQLITDIKAAQSGDELVTLWENYHRLWTDEHTELARERRRELRA